MYNSHNNKQQNNNNNVCHTVSLFGTTAMFLLRVFFSQGQSSLHAEVAFLRSLLDPVGSQNYSDFFLKKPNVFLSSMDVR